VSDASSGALGRFRADQPPKAPAEVVAKGFKCPNCGGPVSLLLPGKSQTIRCPYCSSILEPGHEVLVLREKYNQKYPYKMWIPLAAEGRLDGVKYKCVGMVIRSDEDNGEWSEYLLFNPYFGYRYLVESSGHWTLVEQNAGLGFTVNGAAAWFGPNEKIRLAGKKLRYFTSYTAKVKSVIGEFPWQATIGETNEVTEYINPPYQASCERVVVYYDTKGKSVDMETLLHDARARVHGHTDDDDEGIAAADLEKDKKLNTYVTESNWSLGVYKYPEEIQAAFALKEMPERVGFGMCEPNPMRKRYLVSLAISALLFLATCGSCSVVSGRAEEKPVLKSGTDISIATMELKKEGSADYLEFSLEPGDIELNKATNIEFTVKSDLRQEWLSLNIFMINEETGQGFIYDTELSHYYGGSGDDAWSEGANSTDFTTQKMPPGKYYVYIAGATNAGVKQFKKLLGIYGERPPTPVLPATVPATNAIPQNKNTKKKGYLERGVKQVQTPPATPTANTTPKAATETTVKTGKLLPLGVEKLTKVEWLPLTLTAKRDVIQMGWAIGFVFWLFVWNIYYYIRYKVKEGER